MKWIRRSIWLSAWTLWAYLGLGLHRELPRDLGPAIAKLPVEEGTMLLGFVGDTNTFALQAADRWATIQLLDAETGRELGTRPLPLMKSAFMNANRAMFDTFRSTLRRGVLFGTSPNEPKDARGGTPEGAQVLDVLSGEWRRLSTKPVCYFAAHPDKPWASIIEGKSPASAERAVVIDWQTGRELFSRKFLPACWLSDRPFFLVTPDRYVLPLSVMSGHGAEPSLEVWRLADRPTLEHTVAGIASADNTPAPFSVSLSGRLWWDGIMHHPPGREQDVQWLDVYDFNNRQFLSSYPPNEQPKNGRFTKSYGVARPRISPDGRTVLRYQSVNLDDPAAGTRSAVCALYHIDRGRILWQASSIDEMAESTPDDFLVKEQWHELWKRWFPKLTFETSARRRLEDASLLWRASAKTAIDPKTCKANRTLFVAADGAVHRLPMSPNWPLLALCQTILALPLILLWSLLRWRRRRKASRGRQPSVAADQVSK